MRQVRDPIVGGKLRGAIGLGRRPIALFDATRAYVKWGAFDRPAIDSNAA